MAVSGSKRMNHGISYKYFSSNGEVRSLSSTLGIFESRTGPDKLKVENPVGQVTKIPCFVSFGNFSVHL